MASQRRSGLVLTALAGTFLAADGILLVVAGSWGGKPGLSALGAAFLLAAFSMVGLWKRYQRKLREVSEARADMRREFDLLRREIGGGAHGNGGR